MVIGINKHYLTTDKKSVVNIVNKKYVNGELIFISSDGIFYAIDGSCVDSDGDYLDNEDLDLICQVAPSYNLHITSNVVEEDDESEYIPVSY
jgi:hypothetical protein